jgi:DNA-binding GntR family transcriptional regulator/transcriptional regulator with XRE-family HTH domain
MSDEPAAAPSPSPRPLAEQVAGLLLFRVASGDYKPGEKVPSSAKLAHELQVADSTVDKAKQLLQERGILKIVPLNGTYVCDPLPADLGAPETEPVLDRRGLPSTRIAVLNRDPQPLAAWVAAVLKSRIVNGQYPPGSKLPVRQVLADELDIGQYTLDQGLSRLRAAGLIWSKPVQGTFVSEKIPRNLGAKTPPPRPKDPPTNATRRHGRKGSAHPPVPNPGQLGFGDRTPQEFGEAVRVARRDMDLGVQALADHLGVPHTTLSEIQKGYLRHPNPNTLHKIAAWLADPTDPRLLTAETDTAEDYEQDSPSDERPYFLAWSYWEPNREALDLLERLSGPPASSLPSFELLDVLGALADVGAVRISSTTAMLAAAPSPDQIGELEAMIAEHFGHTDVRLCSWQPFGDQ